MNIQDFSRKEDVELLAGVEKFKNLYGKEPFGDWEKISEYLQSNRSGEVMCRRYLELKDGKLMSSTKWNMNVEWSWRLVLVNSGFSQAQAIEATSEWQSLPLVLVVSAYDSQIFHVKSSISEISADWENQNTLLAEKWRRIVQNIHKLGVDPTNSTNEDWKRILEHSMIGPITEIMASETMLEFFKFAFPRLREIEGILQVRSPMNVRFEDLNLFATIAIFHCMKMPSMENLVATIQSMIEAGFLTTDKLSLAQWKTKFARKLLHGDEHSVMTGFDQFEDIRTGIINDLLPLDETVSDMQLLVL